MRVDIIPHAICCWKISGAFGDSHLVRMLGRLGPLIVRTVWTSKAHSNFCFLLYRICSILNMALDENPVRVFHYLAWEKPELNSSWNSQLLGPIHNNVYVLRHLFHLWEPGFCMRACSKIHPHRD